MMDYAVALSKEIAIKAKDKLIRTIFIGGGTPTYLSLNAWKVIGEEIKKIKKAENMEFSVECNPGTISKDKLSYLKSIGVNRLSIGLQAWQDSLLNALGRIHSLEEFLNGYEEARKCGFDNINIDIMFGLPRQKNADFKETIRNVIKLKPEHISCYSLIVEEGTPFFKLYERDELSVPEEDEEREMYNTAKSILSSSGYKQYEISNFARDEYVCKHNIVYWKLNEYIGCGAAAHSYVDGIRYRNEENIEKYIEMINHEGSSVVEKIENSLQDNMEEFMFMGLRMLEGIDEADFERRFNKKIDVVYKNILDKHIETGLLIRNSERVYLTEKGIELSNMVMSDFIL
jgi:oxygen-independent coproporphyrinogen-3 oxidase